MTFTTPALGQSYVCLAIKDLCNSQVTTILPTRVIVQLGRQTGKSVSTYMFMRDYFRSLLASKGNVRTKLIGEA